MLWGLAWNKEATCLYDNIYDHVVHAGKYNCDVNDIVFIMVLQ